uniref:Uncharacterized protein n=1 Tax=Zooxanthella nutricula TaxID=1333877 RepID=A0A7S2N5L7_9DINO
MPVSAASDPVSFAAESRGADRTPFVLGAFVAGAFAAVLGRRRDDSSNVARWAFMRRGLWPGVHRKLPGVVDRPTTKPWKLLKHKGKKWFGKPRRFHQHKWMLENGVSDWRHMPHWADQGYSGELGQTYYDASSSADNPDFPAYSHGPPTRKITPAELAPRNRVPEEDRKWGLFQDFKDKVLALRPDSVSETSPGFKPGTSTKTMYPLAFGTRGPGLGRAAPEPIAPLVSSAPTASAAGAVFVSCPSAAQTFGMARKRAAFRTAPSRRGGLVLHAHKKAASSTRNQGKGKPGRERPFYGVKFWEDKECKAGDVLAKQAFEQWSPGANVDMAVKKAHLTATKEGVVQFRGAGCLKGRPGPKELFVVPAEYVEKKCIRYDNAFSKLLPKEYEPWMNHKTAKTEIVREHIAKLREEWLESDLGKKWLEKKEAKKEKARQYRKYASKQNDRMWYNRMKTRGIKVDRDPRGKVMADVGATSGGESEAEK